MLVAGKAATACLDAYDLHGPIIEKRMKQPHRIGAAADGRDDQVGQPFGRSAALRPMPITDWKSRTISG